MNASPVEFWFDFSSPYAYLAAEAIDGIAERHGRALVWRPFLLGIVFRETGATPLLTTPLKGNYARRDLERLARFMEVPFRLPDRHPFAALAVSRVFYAIERQDAARAAAFARLAFRACYGEGADLTNLEVLAAIGAQCGCDPASVARMAADPEAKDILKARTDEAVARGIFGSPFTIVDGEPFWGADHLPMVEEWLKRGGW